MDHIFDTVAASIPTAADVAAQSTPEPSDVLHLPADPDQHAPLSSTTHHLPHDTSTSYADLAREGGRPSDYNSMHGAMQNGTADDVDQPTGAPGKGNDAANVAALAGARPRAGQSFNDTISAQKSDPREPDEGFLTTAKKVIRDTVGAAKEEVGYVAHEAKESVTRSSHNVVDAAKTKVAQLTGDTSPEPTHGAAKASNKQAGHTGFLDINLPAAASSAKKERNLTSVTDTAAREMWNASTGNSGLYGSSDQDASMSITNITKAQPLQPPSMENLMNGEGIGAGSLKASQNVLQKDPLVKTVTSGDLSYLTDGLHQGFDHAVAVVNKVPGGAMVKEGIHKTVDVGSDVWQNPKQLTTQLEQVGGAAKVVGGVAVQGAQAAATAAGTAMKTTEQAVGAAGEKLKTTAVTETVRAQERFTTAMANAKRDTEELKDKISGVMPELTANLAKVSDVMSSKVTAAGSMAGTGSALATSALNTGATHMTQTFSTLRPGVPKIAIPVPDLQRANAQLEAEKTPDKVSENASSVLGVDGKLGLGAPASIATGILASVGLMHVISTILSADGGAAGRIMDSQLDTIAHTGGYHTNRWAKVTHALNSLGAFSGMGAQNVATKRAHELSAEAEDQTPLGSNALPNEDQVLATWQPRDFNFQNHWKNDEFVHLNGRWKHIGRAATGDSFVYHLEPSDGQTGSTGLFLRSRNLDQRGHGAPSVGMSPGLKPDATEPTGFEKAGAAKGGQEAAAKGGEKGAATRDVGTPVSSTTRHFAWQMVEKTNVPVRPIVVPRDWCRASLTSANAEGKIPDVAHHPTACARAGCRWDPSEMDPWRRCKDVLLRPGLSGDMGPGRCGNTFCGADEYCGHSSHNAVAQCYHLRVPDNRHMQGVEPANFANKLPMDHVDACTSTSCGPDLACDATSKKCGRARCDASTLHMDGMVCLGKDGAPLGKKDSYVDGGGRLFPRAELLQSFPEAAHGRDVARARWANPTCVDVQTRQRCEAQFPCYWTAKKTFFGKEDPNVGHCDTDCKLFTGNCELYGCGPAKKGLCTAAKHVQKVQVRTPDASSTDDAQPSRAMWNVIHPQPESWEQYTKRLNYAWYCAKSNGCEPGCKGPCGLVLDRGAHQYLGIHSMEPFAPDGSARKGHLTSLGLQHDEQWQKSVEATLKNEAKQYIAAIEKRAPVTNYLFPQYGFMPDLRSAVPFRDAHALGFDYNHPIAMDTIGGRAALREDENLINSFLF